jgi:hypothetical protein
MKIDLVELVEKVYKLEGEPKNVNKVFALICLQAFKEQLTLTDVVKSFVCPNGCGKNGDMGSCIECVGK